MAETNVVGRTKLLPLLLYAPSQSHSLSHSIPETFSVHTTAVQADAVELLDSRQPAVVIFQNEAVYSSDSRQAVKHVLKTVRAKGKAVFVVLWSEQATNDAIERVKWA
ncbi:hypothetical protein HK104_003063, partial [Borealophlyctis nickersoniae]